MSGVLSMIAPKLAVDNYAALTKSRHKDYTDVVLRSSFTGWFDKESPQNRLDHLQKAMKQNRTEAKVIFDAFQDLYRMKTSIRCTILANKHDQIELQEKLQMALYEEYYVLVGMVQQVEPYTLTTNCKTFSSPHANEVMDFLTLTLHPLPAATKRGEVIKALHDAMIYLCCKEPMSIQIPDAFYALVPSPPSSPLSVSKNRHFGLWD